jgi:hypothetical protein
LAAGTWLVALRVSALGISRTVDLGREREIKTPGWRHRRDHSGAKLGFTDERLSVVVSKS